MRCSPRQPYVQVTWAKSIDLKTGRPVLDSTKQTGASKGNVKGVCPSLEGGVSPASPRGVLAQDGAVLHLDQQHVHGLRGGPGAALPRHAVHRRGHAVLCRARRQPRRVHGLGCGTGKKVWEDKEHFPNWSGALVTAGDVAFYGTLDGWFKAVDAKTGKLLSKFKVGSGIVGNPITYRGPDGKQYVAVYAGIGGDWFLLAGDVRSDDPADVRPPSDPYKDIGRHTSQGGIVWIFGL